MAPAEQRKNRSDDPTGLFGPRPPRCWVCGAPEPRSWGVLGASTPNGGTKIPMCAEGEGCKDGRIFHGPQGAPHFPDQDCPICGPAERQRAMRRNAGTANAVVRPGRSARKRPPR